MSFLPDHGRSVVQYSTCAVLFLVPFCLFCYLLRTSLQSYLFISNSLLERRVGESAGKEKGLQAVNQNNAFIVVVR